MTTGRNKRDVRRAHAAARAARSQTEQERLAEAFRDRLLALPEVEAASTVAAFVSQQGEPGTGPFIDALDANGVTIILPILRDDLDLDWAPYVVGAQRPGRFGLLVPTTEAWGLEAVARADVVVCPGVVVDRYGHRLGRGGGSYDRVLARCDDAVLRVQLAYDDEVVDDVPTEPHDQPVHVVVTPTMTLRVSRRAPA